MFASALMVGLCAGIWACGAETTGGNTGSETHWLEICSRDSECGPYACLCGVCSSPCRNDSECDVDSNTEAHCVAVGENAATAECSGATPEQICVPSSDARFERVEDVEHPGQTPDSVDAAAAAIGDIPNDGNLVAFANDGGLVPGVDDEHTICNGSDEIRLVMQEHVGLAVAEYLFPTKYGVTLVAIDGHCNFWLSTPAGAGVLNEGVISDQSVLEFFQSTYFGKLPSIDNYFESDCIDGSTIVMSDPSGTIARNCIEFSSAPGWSSITTEFYSLSKALSDFAQRSTGPLRVAIRLNSEPSSNASPWPIDLDLNAVAEDTVSNFDQALSPGAGILFAPGTRAEGLRQAYHSNWPDFEYTSDGEITSATLLLRDEPPSKVIAVLDAVNRARFLHPAALGATCGDGDTCDADLHCVAERNVAGGSMACTTCVMANDASYACRTDDDCCEGLLCCADCGAQSGSCIEGPAPCAEGACTTCANSGECWAAGCTWLDSDGPGSCTPQNL